jgi:recombination protein RecT
MTTNLAIYEQTRTLLKSADVKARFEEVLGRPEKAQAFLASVLGTVYTNDSLKECDPNSIMFAALKAATLDLPVDPNIGQAAIIPFNSKDGKKAQFQIMYKGLIQLALRTKQYLVINATEVYEGEEIKKNRLTGVIVLNGKPTSDKVKGYASYFKMKSGYEHFLYMTVEELTAHAKKYSKSYNTPGTLWHTNFDAMAKKTVLKLNISKYGEVRIDRNLDEVIREDEDDNIVDGETRDLTKMEPDTEQEQEQVQEKKPAGRPKKEKVEDPPPPEENPEPVVEPPIAEPDTEPDLKETDDGVQMFSRIVFAGLAPDETSAKLRLRFYPGVMDWDHVKPWAAMVKELMDKGEKLNIACGKANDQLLEN